MYQSLSFFHSFRYKLMLSLAYGIFLYLFLLFFLPFGVSNYDPDHKYTIKFLLEMAIFMPVTIVASLINEFLFKYPFRKYSNYKFIVSWTVWSLLYLGLIIFTVYNYLGNWHDWRLGSVPGFVFNTATVLIFPAIGIYFLFRYKRLQENIDAILTNTESGIDKDLMLQFTGEGVKDNLSIAVKDFIYARAQDNYIELYYLRNGNISKFLIRSSLGRLHDNLQYDFLIRCHRSYLINLYNVHSIKGSRKDLQIIMSHADLMIPVSQTYANTTLDGLKKYKRFQ